MAPISLKWDMAMAAYFAVLILILAIAVATSIVIKHI